MATEYIGIVQAVALVAIAAAAWRGLRPSISVNAAPAPAPLIKILMPVDMQKVTAEAHTVLVEQRQPDGTWHRIGDFQIGSEDDPHSWPDRAFSELEADGRRLVFPSGKVMEDA